MKISGGFGGRVILSAHASVPDQAYTDAVQIGAAKLERRLQAAIRATVATAANEFRPLHWRPYCPTCLTPNNNGEPGQCAACRADDPPAREF